VPVSASIKGIEKSAAGHKTTKVVNKRSPIGFGGDVVEDVSNR
jgi:hypothetical protein